MNLVNKQVKHKSFGKGSVVGQTESHIVVSFMSGNKKFVFPDAFGTYLYLTDSRAADSIKKIIEKKEKKLREEELELEKIKALQDQEHQRLLEREKLMKNFRIHPSAQAAFWCKNQDRDRVLTEWRVYTGEMKGGRNNGQPNRPTRMHQNSACLLTARDSNMSEKDRYIIGVYMVSETFI
ncbi:MAG: hypothetical protein PHC45_10410, partial [Clostridiaceae bacterium]|nr:hypothetical protein [Clostridiaceae bacterium]